MFLFYFCAILFFLNIPEIRTFMKLNILLFSNLFKVYSKIIKNSSLLFLFSEKNDHKDNKILFIKKISHVKKSYLNHVQNYKFFVLKSGDSSTSFSFNIRLPILVPSKKLKLKNENFKSVSLENQNKSFNQISEILISPLKFNSLKSETFSKTKNLFLDGFVKSTQKWLYFSFANLSISQQVKSSIKVSFKKESQFKSSFLTLYASKQQKLSEMELFGKNRWIGLKNNNSLALMKSQMSTKLWLAKAIYSSTIKLVKLYSWIFFWISKRFDNLQSLIGMVRSFFQKPNDIYGEIIASVFFVELLTDPLQIVPESSHLDQVRHVNISSRAIRPFVIGYFSSFNNFQWSPFFFQLDSLAFWSTSSFLLQRQILMIYETTLQTFYEPDNDLIIRQKKGQVFTDLWSDVFIDIADKTNLNMTELTSLKDEQNRLFEKIEELQDDNNNYRLPILKPLNWLNRSKRQSNDFIKKNSLSSFNSETSQLKLDNFKRRMSELSSVNKNNYSKNWSVQQSSSFESKNAGLIIKKSPQKSFSEIPSMKYLKSAPAPVGKVVCEIFSGVFHGKVAKNILIIDSNNNQSPFIIQAIAGETELKMIQDNAQRYSTVVNGVTIGIQLLKDVFEALSSQTPCLFLLEDIHHIGSRRPFLYSDHGAIGGELGSDNQVPIDEQNQIMYQLSKHMINHYKKPYKGDFSLLIPPNHFALNLFSASSSPQIRKSFYAPSGHSSMKYKQKLESQTKKEKLGSLSFSESEKDHLVSLLQIESNQLLAPPATSPFSILLLRENRKLKPQQLVKEMPWGGFPSEKLALIEKFNYSIRVKIALLTNLMVSNLSVQLDMITDLLVIIDSVRGNRGFIVFASTNVPNRLDPALRRPGRFDETISLPSIPNLLNRLDIFQIQSSNFAFQTELGSGEAFNNKSSLYSFFFKGNTIDFTKNYNVFESNYQDFVLHFMVKNKNLKRFLSSKFSQQNIPNSLTLSYNLQNQQRNKEQRNLVFIDPLLFSESLHIGKENGAVPKGKSIFVPSGAIKFAKPNLDRIWKNIITRLYFNATQNLFFFLGKIDKNSFSVRKNLISFKHGKDNVICHNVPSGRVNLAKPSLEGTKKGEFRNQDFNFLSLQMNHLILDSSLYLSIFGSQKKLLSTLNYLMAGKLGEFFISSTLTYKSIRLAKEKGKEPGHSGFEMIGESTNIFGIEKIWKSTTALLFSLLTKRYLYNQNLIIPKLLNFSNSSSLYSSSSISNILLPLKRYENYRRTFYSEQVNKKSNFEHKNFQDIWDVHQQQRVVKRLYKLPVREFFSSEVLKNKVTGFGSSLIILSSAEKKMNFTTNSNIYYRNRILHRYQNYIKNQWWNGQLSEHNLEQTFLSDIDWRYMFVNSIGDLYIDFPDTDQFYMVQNRRWVITSNSWKNWFDFQKTNYNSIINQYIFESMISICTSLDKSREILDFYAFNSANEGMLKDLKEITLFSLLKRFYLNK